MGVIIGKSLSLWLVQTFPHHMGIQLLQPQGKWNESKDFCFKMLKWNEVILGDNNINKSPGYVLNWNSHHPHCLSFNPTIEKYITDHINATSHFILICALHSTFGLISDGTNGRDSIPLSFHTQTLHWQEMVYFNWKLAKQNKGKRIPEWGPFLRELLCRWIMHMGESKQQPWALQREQWAAHSPTRAPDFITGLSIPAAWELWDLGQAAAADRFTLTQHTQEPAGENSQTAAYLHLLHCPPITCPFRHTHQECR